FTPSDMPEKKYFIFGDGHGQQFADELGIPFLGQIPIDEKIAASGDSGSPIALDENSPVTKAFDEVAARLREKFK
ncbi:MAG TPA: P-loop NTPase, partial [Bacteroidales bacterium]|nr:P-loop NTPase [Bacteroidales bacterium]